MSKKVEALKAIKQPELKTRRLVLRPFSMDDAEEINTLAGNFNVSKTTLNVPHPYSTEMAESWVATHKAGWEARTNVAYAITLSESGQLIGAIGLHNFEPLRAELGYWLGEPFWGDGYCTEAAKAMIKFSFKNLGLESVTAEHLSSNPASGGVMRKLGMTPVKKIRSQDRYGDLVDVEVYNITNKSQCEDSTHERY